MSTLREKIEKRRTFAIISHPDAGKTTLTEKLLLYGGAIQLAGMVKGKKNSRAATSDWMEIEKQRGISVTSSVMQFSYNDYVVNILDTPGHQDFSEDTYRTLMAADSAVMVIDAARGIEPQTRKLFKVCAMRHIPIFTFINKMDRESRDPFELLEELEGEFGIGTYPMNWPIGAGDRFQGVYDRAEESVLVFDPSGRGRTIAKGIKVSKDDIEGLDRLIGEDARTKLLEELELQDGAGNEMNLEDVLNGRLSPVFFGSALNNFGVEPFLKTFLEMTPPPLARHSLQGDVDPFDEKFSGFFFKIQANMNKMHRDRLAFLRIVSGKYTKDMEVFHVQRNKTMRLAQPQALMAQKREIVEEAVAGDIIGIFDPGIFSIGDTVCDVNQKIEFDGIPTFAPEHFALITQKNTEKRDQFVKGITQIAQEGAIQVYHEPHTGFERIYVGVVGMLQFEVLEYRLKNEYNVEIVRENLDYELLRWIENRDIRPESVKLSIDAKLLEDLSGNPLILFANAWNIKGVEDRNPGLRLSEVKTR